MPPTVSRRAVIAGGAALGGATLLPATAQAAAPAGINGWVTSTMARMTLEEKIGQLFWQYVYGGSATTPDQRNVPLYGVATPAEVVAKYHLGGVIYFAWSDNVTDPTQIATLSNGLQQASLDAAAKARVPLLVATDQEMGVVTRFGPPATQFPGSMALGATRSAAYARSAAAITGQELRAVGINTNFAPDSDVNVNALNPVIGVRSFGSRPELVAELAAAQVRGYQEDGNVSSSTKHFPGHGDTAVDSHTGLPVITHTRAEWERIDAPPFRAAIAAGVDMVMTAHLVVPALDSSGDPATLSRPILTGVLRGELGYEGVIVTDSLAMEGVRVKYGDGEVAVRALLAGVDILLMPPAMDVAWNAVVDAVRSGRISRRDLDAKVRRILECKFRRGIVSEPMVDVAAIPSVVGTAAHQAVADEITDHTITVVRNDARVLPLRPAGRRILVTGYGVTTTQLVSQELAKRGATTQVLQTGTAPTSAQITSAETAARASDTVVVLTNKAWANPAQVTLVKRLLATGVPVVVVAVRDPYDINRFTEATTFVATYSYSPVTPRGLVRALTGEVSPTGKLPVDIPTADNQAVLHPYGHGLTY